MISINVSYINLRIIKKNTTFLIIAVWSHRAIHIYCDWNVAVCCNNLGPCRNRELEKYILFEWSKFIWQIYKYMTNNGTTIFYIDSSRKEMISHNVTLWRMKCIDNFLLETKFYFFSVFAKYSKRWKYFKISMIEKTYFGIKFSSS